MNNKSAMAASYVQISRENLEDWLDSVKRVPGIEGWDRVTGKAGIYVIHLSPFVCVKLSSTIGSSDEAKGKGEASMNLTLVSRLYPDMVLNRKARDRSRFHRTTNWKTTWLEGVVHWISVYKEKADFYDNIARVEDRNKYKTEWIKLIESVPGWASNASLVKNHASLTSGYVLWPSQEEAIRAMLERGQRSTPLAEKTPSRSVVNVPMDAEMLRDLYRLAQSRRETKAMAAIKELGLKAVSGNIPTQDEINTLNSLKAYFGFRG